MDTRTGSDLTVATSCPHEQDALRTDMEISPAIEGVSMSAHRSSLGSECRTGCGHGNRVFPRGKANTTSEPENNRQPGECQQTVGQKQSVTPQRSTARPSIIATYQKGRFDKLRNTPILLLSGCRWLYRSVWR